MGETVNIAAKHGDGRTAVSLAAMMGHKKLGDWMCAHGGRNDVEDNEGRTPLHWREELEDESEEEVDAVSAPSDGKQEHMGTCTVQAKMPLADRLIAALRAQVVRLEAANATARTRVLEKP